jgi:hypothetical protein
MKKFLNPLKSTIIFVLVFTIGQALLQVGYPMLKGQEFESAKKEYRFNHGLIIPLAVVFFSYSD